MSKSIVPVHLAIKAMRDNGYKTAAHAIAELMDNSLQAGASIVELLCSEEVSLVNGKRTLSNIAVLDNGCGMDKDILQLSLQFGNGTHLDAKNQKGMGRFGMGLPAASISIARKVEVWSWQNEVSNALYTYIDIDKIVAGEMVDVPEPIKKPVPHEFIDAALLETVGKTGTLVLWDKIDRYNSKASTLFRNSELLIGRMYRYFIESGKTKIRMYSFNKKIPADNSCEIYALANDPLYLMSRTSCPEPYNETPLFREYPDYDTYCFEIPFNFKGQRYPVNIKYSIAKEEARRDLRNAGSTGYGKHASKNIGVSIVRAGRELNLDTNLCIGYDPRERWWGCEISFPPALDEIFGVTNNKQSAIKFSEVAADIKNNKSNDDRNLSYQQEQEELYEESEGLAFLYRVVNILHTQINLMRGLVAVQKKSTPQNPRHPVLQPEDTATVRTEDRAALGSIGTSDTQEAEMTEEMKQQAIMETLNNQEIDKETSEEIISNLFNPEHQRKYQFIKGHIPSADFFSVSPRGGKILITLNVDHPAYQNLIEVLDDFEPTENSTELYQRLVNASDGLKLLLMAWARFEDEEPVGKRKDFVQNARTDWGRVARDFLRTDD